MQATRAPQETEPVVLVVADRDLVREGIVHVLRDAGLRVSGRRRTDGGDTPSDVVLVVVEAGEAAPGGYVGDSGRVVVLADQVTPVGVEDAIAAGVCGYLLSDIRAGELAAAVRDVANGGTVLHPEAAAVLRARVAGKSPADGAGPLTDRQRQILGLLGEGLQNKQIARQTGLTVYTVKTHVTRIFDKLGVSSRTEAAATAMRLGLVA